MTDDAPTPADVPAMPASTFATPVDAQTRPSLSDSRAAAAPAAGRGLSIGALALAAIALGFAVYAWQQGKNGNGDVAQMQDRIDRLGQRLEAMEKRPAPPVPDLGPLQQRLTALENKPAPAPVDLGPLQQRVTALETKPAPVAQLDKAGQEEIAALASRVDAITARQNLLGTQEQTDIGKANQQLTDSVAKVTDQEKADIGRIDGQLAGMNTRLDAAAKSAGEIMALDTRQTRLAQLQAAAGALAAGRALGPIQGAPPALAAFATKRPPTEAELRLSFDEAAAAARKAGQPYADTQPFLSRMWDRAQSGLVVREGDRVIVGDAVSGVLEHARRQLDAGDLAGAVAALGGLAGPAAQAMAPWRAQAQSLLDARAALISAAHG